MPSYQVTSTSHKGLKDDAVAQERYNALMAAVYAETGTSRLFDKITYATPCYKMLAAIPPGITPTGIGR
ncbi:hypothetical protein BH10PSE19_BH10PSE19_09030 [soil metagenome]